jgi:2-iminobutanoate/2-iminopropanoate deaminase
LAARFASRRLGGERKAERGHTSRTMKRIIATRDAPEAVGPYSQAVAVGDMLFCAGQIPLDPATGALVEGDVTAQTTRVLENVAAVLRAHEMSFANVVKSTVFMIDLAEFAAMNAVYAKFFTEPFPARSTVQVAALPKGAAVEIEVVAMRG